MGDFSPKVIPESALGLVLGAVMGVAGWTILLLGQSWLLRAWLSWRVTDWTARSSLGLLIGWCLGWAVTACGLAATRGTGFAGGAAASAVILGSLTGICAAVAQQGIVAGRLRRPASWVLAGLAGWLVGGLLYALLYPALGGVASTPVGPPDPAFGQLMGPAEGGLLLWRAVAGGWLAAGLVVGLITGLVLKYQVAGQSGPPTPRA